MHSETIDQIRYWHRQRCFAMEQRKRIDLSLGAFLRLVHGWSPDKTEEERKAIKDHVADLMKDADGTEWAAIVNASELARAPFAAIEKRSVSEMEVLAEMLPVWNAFGKEIRGFGPASLAVILGEAGDLGNYSTHSKLWKRMGVAVMDGVRQGGLPKSAAAEDWIAHGYNRQRRSRLWNIGDALIKGNREGYYRTVYLQRKAYELEREPEMKPIKAHLRAQRYMEKRLLKKLWQAWRQAVSMSSEKTDPSLPAGSGEALRRTPEKAEKEMPPASKGRRQAAGKAPAEASRKMLAASGEAMGLLPEKVKERLPSASIKRKQRAGVGVSEKIKTRLPAARGGAVQAVSEKARYQPPSAPTKPKGKRK